MNPDRQLSITWLKAAVLGCLWASSEIVLGSFLHNLRVPFSSIFLTSIGIILLVSVSFQWKDKGLIWRSGLICALMKSVSPSAVIFGPMIAIMSEALLLEIAVRSIGRNMVGFMLGSLLAMSWNFMQKIANYLIFYGFNIVDLYASMVKFAEKQLHMHFNTVWMPIIVLWIFYLFFGIVSAGIGIYIGKTASGKSIPMLSSDKSRMAELKSKSNSSSARPSLWWLAFNFLGMISVLLLMNLTGILWWFSVGTMLIAIWAVRYKSALRPLMKPKFWIFFVVITMLSSFLFASFQSDGLTLADGMLIGLQMNFRAAIMIVGFSVVGKELSNPVIRNFFIRTSFRQLPLALEIAFETLPFVIANLPSLSDIFKKPVTVMRQIVAQSEFWLEKVALTMKKKSNVIIITGEIGSGKTTLISAISLRLKESGIKTGGILAAAIYEQGNKTGYNILGVSSGSIMLLSQTKEIEGMPRVGKFFFIPEAIDFGVNALSVEKNRDSQIVLIDEIGAWELQGQGWASSLNELIINSNMPLILTVRKSFLDLVIDNWKFQDPLVIEAKETSVVKAYSDILKFVPDL
ncbi:MAG: nucleoside-triphosphatase [Bacteroidales bacterium]|nr:nucleoside-triphosphatase [Bacteroidales bacterium]